MPAPSTGEYLVRFYDDHGRSLKVMDHIVGSITQAQEYGDAVVATGEAHSFTVDRRLFNSLDRRGRW